MTENQNSDIRCEPIAAIASKEQDPRKLGQRLDNLLRELAQYQKEYRTKLLPCFMPYETVSGKSFC
jgi:hypothetical protein